LHWSVDKGLNDELQIQCHMLNLLNIKIYFSNVCTYLIQNLVYIAHYLLLFPINGITLQDDNHCQRLCPIHALKYLLKKILEDHLLTCWQHSYDAKLLNYEV